jgi:glutamate racemase
MGDALGAHPTHYPPLASRDSPLGVFDSGIGGLSVLLPLREQVPAEDVLYAADAAWCPYGPRPAAVIRERAFRVVDALLRRGAKLIVVACNSASAAALDALRGRYPGVPFVGMEPAVKPAAAQTRRGAVGVLATAATARGGALARLVDRFGRGVAVHVAVPRGLVELVEAGLGNSAEAEGALRPIVTQWMAAGVDVIVLGCTHYPFARGAVERLAGPSIAVVDPAPAVARQAYRVLQTTGLTREAAEAGRRGRLTFLTSGEPAALRAAVERVTASGWSVGAHFAAL